jgi:hypothetical protein
MTNEPLRLELGDFRGWPAVYLRNGLATVVAVPDIGGRLMAFDLGPYPFLYVDRDLAGKLFTLEENQGDGSLAAWKNYGGNKTWPAPQGWDTEAEWHGPPDPILDSGRYTLIDSGVDGKSAWVEMVSPPEPYTGLQITRKACLLAGSARLALDLSFTNISQRPVRWSIWDVTQLRAERVLPGGTLVPETACAVSTPLNPLSRFLGGFNVMFGSLDNPQWSPDPARRLFIGNYRWEIGKVGIDSPDGWIAFSNAATGYAFTERFPFFPGAEYPDGGASVECWTVGRGKVANLDYEHSAIYLMETEVLSPLFLFEPGQSRSFHIEWGACRCPGPVLDVQEAGCTAELLALDLQDGFIHLKGAFGAFDVGELSLIWRNMADEILASTRLGTASPLEMVLLDGVYPRPEGAVWVELQVTAGIDGLQRRLAAAALEVD